MSTDDRVLDLMFRAERGLQHAQDAQILLAALKSAANSHTEPSAYLTFLKFHIKNGMEHIQDLSTEK